MRIQFIQDVIDFFRGKKKVVHVKIDWSDEKKNIENIKVFFKQHYGYELDIDNPKTLSEKMMWLRIHDNTPLKTQLADKYLAREYVKEKIGEEYLPSLLGVYDTFDEINFDELPKQFALKCNHGCGYNIIVTDKDALDINEAKAKVNKWMNEIYSHYFGETHYNGIIPQIIIEEYLSSLDEWPADYKYFCFNGKPHYIQYCTNRELEVKTGFFSLAWENKKFNYTDILIEDDNIPAPKNLEKMNELAEKLCQDFKHVRIDLYNVSGKIYFGEFTFTSYGGYFDFKPKEWDLKLGNLLDLNK